MPKWAKEQGFEDNKAAVAGATLFAESGCANCHTYLGSGSSNLGAPDLLRDRRDDGKTAEQFANYVANPAEFGNNVMPPYGKEAGGAFTDQQLAAGRRVPVRLQGPGKREGG